MVNISVTGPPVPESRMENPYLRVGLLIAIVVTLYPILLGGIAGRELIYRRQWQIMREDHLRRIAEGRARYLARLARLRALREAEKEKGESQGRGRGRIPEDIREEHGWRR
jgi:hypothetical protein